MARGTDNMQQMATDNTLPVQQMGVNSGWEDIWRGAERPAVVDGVGASDSPRTAAAAAVQRWVPTTAAAAAPSVDVHSIADSAMTLDDDGEGEAFSLGGAAAPTATISGGGGGSSGGVFIAPSTLVEPSLVQSALPVGALLPLESPAGWPRQRRVSDDDDSARLRAPRPRRSHDSATTTPAPGDGPGWRDFARRAHHIHTRDGAPGQQQQQRQQADSAAPGPDPQLRAVASAAGQEVSWPHAAAATLSDIDSDALLRSDSRPSLADDGATPSASLSRAAGVLQQLQLQQPLQSQQPQQPQQQPFATDTGGVVVVHQANDHDSSLLMQRDEALYDDTAAAEAEATATAAVGRVGSAPNNASSSTATPPRDWVQQAMRSGLQLPALVHLGGGQCAGGASPTSPQQHEHDAAALSVQRDSSSLPMLHACREATTMGTGSTAAAGTGAGAGAAHGSWRGMRAPLPVVKPHVRGQASDLDSPRHMLSTEAGAVDGPSTLLADARRVMLGGVPAVPAPLATTTQYHLNAGMRHDPLTLAAARLAVLGVRTRPCCPSGDPGASSSAASALGAAAGAVGAVRDSGSHVLDSPRERAAAASAWGLHDGEEGCVHMPSS